MARSIVAESPSINYWLARTHSASKTIAYIGTFVVSSGGAMSSAKVFHACEGDRQIERVETLSGPPRSIFRHNDQVVTFLIDQKVVRSERRDSLGAFPGLLDSNDTRIADFYRARHEGVARVAGVAADVTTLIPKDSKRFGYRVWTEQRRGLLVKSQTLDSNGKVLEQSAFSELQLDAPVRVDQLMQMMANLEGYRVENTDLVKTTAASEGWALRVPVAGFMPLHFYRRPVGNSNGAQGADALQWIFSDGLASVSIFVEPSDSQRQQSEGGGSVGATQTLTRQIENYWLTLVGEVPMGTLRLFADSLERRASK
ncbi:MAG: MucB/RseB C-terminal domain-containing protein [Polaromonas sp.]|nr:MucB/RseB C-terminal domain-containing protein [Polaromonas sp.]